MKFVKGMSLMALGVGATLAYQKYSKPLMKKMKIKVLQKMKIKKHRKIKIKRFLKLQNLLKLKEMKEKQTNLISLWQKTMPNLFLFLMMEDKI